MCTLHQSVYWITYCKCGYFRWGKISRKCWQDISRGGNFHDTSPISFREAYGFYFCIGVIFAKNAKAQKTRKLPPREKFHVYSTTIHVLAIGCHGVYSRSSPGEIRYLMYNWPNFISVLDIYISTNFNLLRVWKGLPRGLLDLVEICKYNDHKHLDWTLCKKYGSGYEKWAKEILNKNVWLRHVKYLYSLNSTLKARGYQANFSKLKKITFF